MPYTVWIDLQVKKNAFFFKPQEPLIKHVYNGGKSPDLFFERLKNTFTCLFIFKCLVRIIFIARFYHMTPPPLKYYLFDFCIPSRRQTHSKFDNTDIDIIQNISFVPHSYYTLMMWFPELFNRFETFERLEPGTDSSVCQVSSVYIQQDGNKNTADLCGSAVGESVYTHTLWIGIACIPTSLWLPLCVHRLGAKFFLGKTSDFTFTGLPDHCSNFCSIQHF